MGRKQKKTFSLTPDSVAYLKALAKNYGSASEAVDAIIREKQSQAEKEKVSVSIRHYYDSLDNQERQENRNWGEFAETQFPEEVD